MIICSQLCPSQPQNSTYIVIFGYTNDVHSGFLDQSVVSTSYFRSIVIATVDYPVEVVFFALDRVLSIVSVLQNSTHSILHFGRMW
jgi:hypothetical protein